MSELAAVVVLVGTSCTALGFIVLLIRALLNSVW